MRLVRVFAWWCAGAGLLAGCEGKPAQLAASAPAAPTRVVDSVLPREVEIARFRAGLPPVASLSGGASSREALIRRFVTALETSDTAGLRNLLMSRAEFAWLYYP